MTGTTEGEFEIDFTNLPDASVEGSEERETPISGDNDAGAGVGAAQRLEELLEPYSEASVKKARDLLRLSAIEEVKQEGQMRWFNVRGSKLYVVKITRGEDFLFAECSCPNGVHRGGEAICYHSIAARALEAGLASEWVPITEDS